MKRRVGESLLDDIPGISEARKRALLARFGSVTRIRRLTPDTLASVPGISRRLADTIKSWLETH
jgi:excinuclease ABC subunit C